jgi:hypothetical protein
LPIGLKNISPSPTSKPFRKSLCVRARPLVVPISCLFCHHEPTSVGEGSAFSSLLAGCFVASSNAPSALQSATSPQEKNFTDEKKTPRCVHRHLGRDANPLPPSKRCAFSQIGTNRPPTHFYTAHHVKTTHHSKVAKLQQVQRQNTQRCGGVTEGLGSPETLASCSNLIAGGQVRASNNRVPRKRDGHRVAQRFNAG